MTGLSEQRRKRPDLAERNRSGHEHPIFPMGEEGGTKHCTACCTDLPLGEFYPDRKSGSHRANCKACQRIASKLSYYRNHEPEKAKRTERNAARASEHYKKLAELKDVPCADCGGRFPPVCMDFDHVRGEKIAHVGRMINHYPWERIAAEIEKCEVVCANCHRIRTFLRAQSWKSKAAREELKGVI